MRFQTLPPLSLYVHLPWCVRKCPYCDFNSYRAPAPLAEDAYVEALLRDLEAEAELVQERAFASVFIGGGTPSLFSGDAIARLLEGIRARTRLSGDAEITLEANPGAVDTARFAAYRTAGVNRLSIGIQSFRDAQLEALGRVHDAREAALAVEAARGAGFRNVNLDLMYGLPGDDLAGALADLAAAVALEPSHLSWYQLTLEPNTAFYRRPPSLPDEAGILEIETTGRALLAAHGFRRYEVSAYRRGKHGCVHNLNYWQFGDYLGIGAGAQGKITIASDGSIQRRAKSRNPRTYVEQAGSTAAVSLERVDGKQRALEFMMNALRLPDGIRPALFEERTGLALDSIAAPLRAAAARGWLRADAERIQPTPVGLGLLNSMLALFVPEPERPVKTRAHDRRSSAFAALGATARSGADQPL